MTSDPSPYLPIREIKEGVGKGERGREGERWREGGGVGRERGRERGREGWKGIEGNRCTEGGRGGWRKEVSEGRKEGRWELKGIDEKERKRKR